MNQRSGAPGDDPPSHRRRSQRHTVATMVWYKVVPHEAEATPEGVARSVDISQSGLGIIVPSSLPLKRLIWLELSAGQVRMSALGKTVFSINEREYYRVGIEFVVIPPNDRIQLREFCTDEKG